MIFLLDRASPRFRLRSESGANLAVILVAMAATAVVLGFFAVDTLRNAPETFVSIVVIALLAVVLDIIWKRMRGPVGPPESIRCVAPDRRSAQRWWPRTTLAVLPRGRRRRCCSASRGSGTTPDTSTADLEERIEALADALGLVGTEISATPTIVEISLGSIPISAATRLRVRPSVVDLDAIAGLDELVQDLLAGRLDAGPGARRPRERPGQAAQTVVAARARGYGLAGAALTPVLGGGWREAIAAAVVGLVVGGIAIAAERAARAAPMVAPIAAVAASFCAVSLMRAGSRHRTGRRHPRGPRDVPPRG